MKQHRIYFVLFLFFLVASSFAKSTGKAKSSVPQWLTDDGRISVFPKGKYISACASNKSAELSKQDAASEISKFLKSEIISRDSASQTFRESNGNFFGSTMVNSESEIFSAETLYGLEFTQPYFSEKENKYYCVAYIEKQNAWKLVKVDLERISEKVANSYKNARSDSADEFSKTVFYVKTKNMEEEFFNAYFFAIVVNESETKKFDATKKILSDVEFEIAAGKSKNTILINVQNDNNDFVLQKISDVFDKNGFSPVKGNSIPVKYTASAICNAVVKQDGEIFSCTPGIKIEVVETKTGKIVFSFSESTKRVAGKNVEAAQKVVYRELGKIIENEFLK